MKTAQVSLNITTRLAARTMGSRGHLPLTPGCEEDRQLPATLLVSITHIHVLSKGEHNHLLGLGSKHMLFLP